MTTVATVATIARATRKDLSIHTGTTLKLLVTLKDESGTIKSASSMDEAKFVLRITEGDIVKTFPGSGITIDTSNSDGKGRVLVTILPGNTVGVDAQTGRYELVVTFIEDRAAVLWGRMRVTKSIAEPDAEFSLTEVDLDDDEDFET